MDFIIFMEKEILSKKNKEKSRLPRTIKLPETLWYSFLQKKEAQPFLI